MTPKKRTVDKNAVKYDLYIGKSPGEIAKLWGVSRQYVSSIRQELVKDGTLQRGKPGRPKKLTLSVDDRDLELSDIEHVFQKIQSMILKFKSLEEERTRYKIAYKYVLEILDKYVSEGEKQYIQAMTNPQFSGHTFKVGTTRA